ncbi:hypothetical protein AAE02nite_02120 [Adhaeribacter aerolatus]|uniref:DUF72 domain-containing protein n=1 Tax=Adhaeribacter aerolatus TaxID=670289 RepID=A0A512AS55_9BACT|nr:DUF72 domain-containing protein [Adhaeribacter aerolatus]GEO02548.1 hypothetical protein AAE02nite_02120 [Adhaeribacter aerolatus]
MDFGRVDSIQAIRFVLPPDAVGTAEVLKASNRLAYLKPEVYVGCPTWNNKPWLGSYYPAGAKAADQLELYSKQFNTIELNTTHYRIPDAATINRWRETVTPNFTFCPKLPQVISHELQLKNTETITKNFCDSLQGLEEHLGCSFLQLPPTFGPNQLDSLMRYLDSFPRGFPLALELREEDWFRQNVKSEALWVLLEAYNLATVITDVAGRRDVLHMRLTNATAFIRFVGNGLHPTDYTRIDDWVARLNTWFDWGLQKLYFFIHQPDINHAPVLISYFLDRLKQTYGIALDKPQIILQPVQGRLF